MCSGGGEIGKLIKEELTSNGIRINAFIVDTLPDFDDGDKYISPTDYLLDEKFILIRGFLQSFSMHDGDIIMKFPNCIKTLSIVDMYEPDIVESLEEEFYLNNKNRFLNVRENFSDAISKKSFDAFMHAKLYLDNKPLLPIVEKTQYFFPDSPWKYTSDEVYLDCGAYTGDNIRDFIDAVGGSYRRIIAVEPDLKNHRILKENVRKNGWEKINLLACGIYEKRDVLRFSSADMESKINEEGDIEVSVDAIDNLFWDQPVSIIKMDIEGVEMSALRGAQRTIQKNRPILMISAYHKKSDLFDIYEFISGKVSEYSFFFRCHKPLAIDAVLYAVPNERIINNN